MNRKKFIGDESRTRFFSKTMICTAISSLLLVGCNSDKSDSEESILEDTLLIMEYQVREYRDIGSRSVYDIPAISKVSIVEGEDLCSSSISEDGKIVIDNLDYGSCQFDLTTTAGDSQRLITNFSSTSGTIPTLSSLLVVEQNTTIDISERPEIKAFLDDGYALNATEITVVGDIDATASGTQFAINSKNSLGSNRIYYFLEKSIEGEIDSKTGVIDIVVSAKDNTAPSIDRDKYEKVIDSRTYYNIDLLNPPEGEPIISDNTPDNLHIIDIDSPLGGEVRLGTYGSPLARDAEAGVKFFFKADQIGDYPINYTVSDREGGYATGYVIFQVGALTSPDSPHASKPGRMVESNTITDGELTQYIKRPYLKAEVSHLEPGINHVTRDGELWAYGTRAQGVSICDQMGGLKLPTAEALEQLYDDFSATGIKAKLGWQQELYLTQETHRADSNSKISINMANRNRGTTDGGLIICVNSPETIITSSPNLIQIEPRPIEHTGSSVLSNVGNAPQCISSDPSKISVIECSREQLTVGASRSTTAKVTISTDGENIIGSEPPAEVNVISELSSGMPSIPSAMIEAETSSGVWEVVTDLTSGVRPDVVAKVRPGTKLRLSFDYSDPDEEYQPSLSTFTWSGTGFNIVDGTDSGTIATPTGLGSVSATITPKNVEETGSSVSLSFEIINRPPSVEDLTIVPDGQRGYFHNEQLNPSYTFADPDGDAIDTGASTWSWSKRHPWGASTWDPVHTGESLPADLSRTLSEGGFEVKFEMKPVDSLGAQGTPVSKEAIAVANVETNEIPYGTSSTLNVHMAKFPLVPDSSLSVWSLDEMCKNWAQTGGIDDNWHTYFRMLREESVFDYINRADRIPAFYSKDFQDYPVFAYANRRGEVASWDSLDGGYASDWPSYKPNYSLVCEEVPNNPSTFTIGNFSRTHGTLDISVSDPDYKPDTISIRAQYAHFDTYSTTLCSQCSITSPGNYTCNLGSTFEQVGVIRRLIQYRGPNCQVEERELHQVFDNHEYANTKLINSGGDKDVTLFHWRKDSFIFKFLAPLSSTNQQSAVYEEIPEIRLFRSNDTVKADPLKLVPSEALGSFPNQAPYEGVFSKAVLRNWIAKNTSNRVYVYAYTIDGRYSHIGQLNTFDSPPYLANGDGSNGWVDIWIKFIQFR